MDRQTEKLKLAFDDIGTGEPTLLLLPGWCSDRGILASLAERLSEKQRVINVDLLGHNESDQPMEDFASEDIIREALKLVDSLGINELVTVSIAHAGWIAVELRRRLVHRISKMVFLEWIIIEPPQIFFEILEKMQKPDEWQDARDELFAAWSLGDANLAKPFYEFMSNYNFNMWSRAGREISKSYKEFGSALSILQRLNPPPNLLSLYSPAQATNLYAQDDDSSYFDTQQRFARNHSWFHFRRLGSKSHLPSVEVTQEVAEVIENFIRNS
ncbi:alpha/beta fold hydrolase [Scytonema sp. UIC 10036]|uniref:alpha/beta fold hydrolase n=1 Tax=Scytonema sp. UIC 10036 TaxID=2304196 RepID=UPI0012DACAB1|nr:alpha/beta hydrolase [Scytonema sp. UIC 10036]MUG99426.1 alpha/beta fold hydrolase [Scytonema sp. UIC 10036]